MKYAALAFLASACAVACPASAQTDADARFTLAMAAYRNDGDSARARRLLDETLAMNPKHKAATFNRAMLAEEAEEWPTAIKWYEAYRTLDADGPYATAAAAKVALIRTYIAADATPEGKRGRIYRQYMERARSHLAAGRPGAAIAMAELAIESDAARHEGYAAYGAALMAAERFVEAGDKLRLAIDRAPAADKTGLVAMAALATRYSGYQTDLAAADAAYAASNYQKAAETYGRVWAVLDDPAFGFQAANAWALASRRDKAGDILATLAKSPEASVAARAAEEAKKLAAGPLATSLDPQRDAATAAVNGPAFVRARQQIAARNFYGADAELSLIIQPMMPDASAAPLFEHRAIARIGANDMYSALQDLTMLLLLDPRSRSGLTMRSEIYAKLGRPGEAARDVERLIELAGDAAERKRLTDLRAKYLTEENRR